MSMNFNIANEARGMSDAELSASIRTLTDEQMRRASIPESERPDPRIAKMLRERHENLYGNHLVR